MSTFERMIKGSDSSEAWLNATTAVLSMPQHHGYHLVVSIDNAATSEPRAQRLVDQLAKRVGVKYDVESIANTIFPQGLVRGSDSFADVTKRFLSIYPMLRKFPGNARGTYFGRMIALPATPEPINQIQIIIDRLKGRPKKKTPYQIDMIGGDIKAYDAASDKNVQMAFPCLSFCAVQRDEDKVHLSAHYRNHYMIERAYGNYLGLGRLLKYIADQAGLVAGTLTVISGHAEIDRSPKLVHQTLRALSKLRA